MSAKKLTKGVGGFAWRTGRAIRNSDLMVRGLSRLYWGGGSVLRFHSVCDDPGWRGEYIQKSLAVPPDVFDRQIAFVTKRHRVVSVAEIAENIRAGRRVVPRSIAITFDDGYEDNFRFAYPILKKHGATATFYVATGAANDEDVLWTVRLRCAIRQCERPGVSLSFLGSGNVDLSTDDAKESTIKMLTGIVKRCNREEIDEILSEVHEAVGPQTDCRTRRIMMSWDEIREMHEGGMGIGAHTLSHYNLPSLDTSDVAQEVLSSKQTLEEVLSAPVEHFAYPNGRTDRHCDARVAKIVAVTGFKSAVTSLSGPVTSTDSEYCIARLGVVPRHRDVSRLGADIQHARFRHQNQHIVDEIGRAFRGQNGNNHDPNGNNHDPNGNNHEPNGNRR